MDAVEKVTRSEPKRKNNRKKRSASSARLARSTILSMKVNNSGHICKKDLTHFINTFFPEKSPLTYSRLSSVSKLLVCQYVMHNEPGNNFQSIPFVFRLSPELQQMDATSLNKKVQRKLSKALGRKPLFWTTREHDGGLDKTITHINGEIQLYPHELKKVRSAFREIFVTAKRGIDYAIRFPLTRRAKETQRRGEFYAVYNWVGYVTKQDWQRDIDKRKQAWLKQSLPDDTEKFFYISGELYKIASNFYSERIMRKTGSSSGSPLTSIESASRADLSAFHQHLAKDQQHEQIDPTNNALVVGNSHRRRSAAQSIQSAFIRRTTALLQPRGTARARRATTVKRVEPNSQRAPRSRTRTIGRRAPP